MFGLIIHDAMKRFAVLGVLLLAFKPLYGIGFWAEILGSSNNFYHDKLSLKSEKEDVTFDNRGNGTLYGGGLSGGVSLAPLPLLVGVGASYTVGSGITEWKFGEDRWDATRLDVKLSVAYRLKFPFVHILVGATPGFVSMTLNYKNPDADFYDVFFSNRITYSGAGFGLFAKGYLMLDALGLGGGVSFDFTPSLSSTEITDYAGKTTLTLSKNTSLSLYLGVFLLSGILE